MADMKTEMAKVAQALTTPPQLPTQSVPERLFYSIRNNPNKDASWHAVHLDLTAQTVHTKLYDLRARALITRHRPPGQVSWVYQLAPGVGETYVKLSPGPGRGRNDPKRPSPPKVFTPAPPAPPAVAGPVPLAPVPQDHHGVDLEGLSIRQLRSLRAQLDKLLKKLGA